METKIQLKHPGGKKAISMRRDKYETLRTALLEHLKSNGESTHSEIWQTIEENFKKNKIKFEGSIQWHLEWVKLDLEANKMIGRVPGTSPQKFAIAK